MAGILNTRLYIRFSHGDFIFLRHKTQVVIEIEFENTLKYNQETKNHSLFC